MSRLAKDLRAASVAATDSGGVLVDDLFSTFLYQGNSSTRTITNGINLADDGGLVWMKADDVSNQEHIQYDTARGVNKYLSTGSNTGESTVVNGVTSFNTDGWTMGSYSPGNGGSTPYHGWAFKQHDRFFKLVTWTGDGSNSRVISHGLGCEPSLIVVKNRTSSSYWPAVIRGAYGQKFLFNTNDAPNSFNTTDNGYIGNNITTTTFDVVNGGSGVNNVNALNDEYIAWVWGQNNSAQDQIFGPNQDEPVIIQGTYTGTGNSDGPEINVGFEPAFIFIKPTSTTAGYHTVMLDMSRPGMTTVINGNSYPFWVGSNSTQVALVRSQAGLLPRGFKIGTSSGINNTGQNYSYVAIRRSMREAESGTDVFAPIIPSSLPSGETPEINNGFFTDMCLYRPNFGILESWRLAVRNSNQQYLSTDNQNGSNTDGSLEWKYMTGLNNSSSSNNSINYSWKRSPGVFDYVSYWGTNAAFKTIYHNLGVAPEMIWVKDQTGGNTNWGVYSKYANAGTNPADYYATLNTSDEFQLDTNSQYFYSTEPTAEYFQAGLLFNNTNRRYVACLFASKPGISKLGYVNMGPNDVNVNCGFSNGARFVMIKEENGLGNWRVLDSAQGYGPNADYWMALDSNNPRNSSFDILGTYAQGFTMKGGSVFTNGKRYIFFAMA